MSDLTSPRFGDRYTVRKIREEGEGEFIAPLFHGIINEWKLVGISARFSPQPVNAQGQYITQYDVTRFRVFKMVPTIAI